MSGFEHVRKFCGGVSNRCPWCIAEVNWRGKRMERKQIKIGDWVRFYCAGKLVIGVVEYIESQGDVLNRTWLLTSEGRIDRDAVVEHRSRDERTK